MEGMENGNAHSVYTQIGGLTTSGHLLGFFASKSRFENYLLMDFTPGRGERKTVPK